MVDSRSNSGVLKPHLLVLRAFNDPLNVFKFHLTSMFSCRSDSKRTMNLCLRTTDGGGQFDFFRIKDSVHERLCVAVNYNPWVNLSVNPAPPFSSHCFSQEQIKVTSVCKQL